MDSKKNVQEAHDSWIEKEPRSAPAGEGKPLPVCHDPYPCSHTLGRTPRCPPLRSQLETADEKQKHTHIGSSSSVAWVAEFSPLLTTAGRGGVAAEALLPDRRKRPRGRPGGRALSNRDLRAE
eukprot:scaffold926_cov248-Pinguiococcus_pyrenoidosus.AAC.2